MDESDRKINSGNINEDVRNRLGKLYEFLSNRLKIKESPKLSFIEDIENSENPVGFTGFYDPSTRHIKIYVTGRHATDILRTFAHEMIHHWQNENGKFANIKSEYKEGYAQNSPNLRKCEMEAYLAGNIYFRDWQDSMRK